MLSQKSTATVWRAGGFDGPFRTEVSESGKAGVYISSEEI